MQTVYKSFNHKGLRWNVLQAALFCSRVDLVIIVLRVLL